MLEATELNAYMKTTKTKSKQQTFQLGFQTENTNWPIYVQFECITGECVRKQTRVPEKYNTVFMDIYT